MIVVITELVENSWEIVITADDGTLNWSGDLSKLDARE